MNKKIEVKTEEKSLPVSNTRQFDGEVMKKSADKSVSVLVKSVKIHSKYHKQYFQTRKYLVHDEKNIAKVGDLVSFVECRPISKTKKWRLVKVLKSA